jgi:hypothetical protein
VPNTTRELAELVNVLLDASASLATHARTINDRLIGTLPPDEPPAPLTASAGPVVGNDMTAQLVWDNSGTGEDVTIDWGVTDVVDDQEPATGTKTYQYEEAGDYVITVAELDNASRTVSVDVTVPFVTGA